MRLLRKHWPTLVACAALGLGVALVYTRTLPRVYESSAIVEFDPRPIRPIAEQRESAPILTSYWDNKEYYETQYRIVTSTRVMGAVIKALNLQNEFTFYGADRMPATPPTEEALVAALRAHIRVEPVKGSRLVQIKVEDIDAGRAKRICSAVVSTYVTQNLERSVAATSDAAVWLNGQVDHFKQELESNENALHEFKLQNQLPSTSLSETTNIVRAEMAAYSEALTRTRTKKQELAARSAALSKVVAEDAELPASELLSSEFLGGVRARYLESQKTLAQIKAEGKGDNHPMARKASEDVALARQALISEVKNIQGAVARDLQVLAGQEAGETSLYEDARRRAVDLNMKEIEYRRLDRSREQNEKLYAMLIQRMKEADLGRMMNVNNVRQLDPPTTPRGAVRPQPTTNAIVGLALGLLVGVLACWVRHELDNTVKTPDDLEHQLGVTFLGLLPLIGQEEDIEDARKPGRRKRRRASAPLDYKPELAAHTRPRSGVAEASRSIRTNLMFMNPDKPHRVLLVSSASPGEGKTTVAANLAVALAQGGQRVVIVDADLRRPRLHRVFDRSGDMGVTNVLIGEASLDDVIKGTPVDNLWSIPAGPTPPNAADVLHTQKFAALVRELTERFDRVVIDSPPVVPVTDAAIISTIVDGVILVFRAFKTTRTLARQGLRTFRDVDAPVLGAVLNSVDLEQLEYKYYPQYYYYRTANAYQTPPQPTDDEGAMEAPAGPPN